VKKFDVPIEATTPSLESLKNYSIGDQYPARKGKPAAQRSVSEVVQVKPGQVNVLVTDGVTEAGSPEEFGVVRMLDYVRA
jgi:hypothetical protein